MKLAKSETGAFLNRYEHAFWELTKFILAKDADFDDDSHSFTLKNSVVGCRKGIYSLIGKDTDCIPYRLSCPLAQYVLQTALNLDMQDGGIIFEKDASAINITLPDYLQKASGYLVLSKLNVSAFDSEQYCLFTAFTKDGKFLSQEDSEKLFLYGGIEDKANVSDEIRKKLSANSTQHTKAKLQEIDSRNLSYFKEEEDRIFRWEQDLIGSIEKELDTVKNSIREQERLSRNAENMEEKLAITKKIDELERKKRKMRVELADKEDEVSEKRRQMIAELDKKMIKTVDTDDIFVVSWSVR